MNHKNIYKGTLEALIIQLIDTEGEMYGYEITQKIKQLTNEDLKLTEGTLYPLLHKLENEGILESYFVEIGNRPRKYYRIAEEGKGKVEESKHQLSNFISNLQKFLNPKLA